MQFCWLLNLSVFLCLIKFTFQFHFWKIFFLEYRILDWLFLLVLYWCCATILCGLFPRRNLLSSFSSLLYNGSIFFLLLLRFLFFVLFIYVFVSFLLLILSLAVSNFILMCLVAVFFGFEELEVYWASGSVILCFPLFKVHSIYFK